MVGSRVSDPTEELEERLQKEREASAEDQKWLQEASDAFIPASAATGSAAAPTGAVAAPKPSRVSRLGSEESDAVVKVNRIRHGELSSMIDAESLMLNHRQSLMLISTTN